MDKGYAISVDTFAQPVSGAVSSDTSSRWSRRWLPGGSLGGTIRLIFAVLGYSYSGMVDQTEVRALVMATNMVIGML